MLTEDIFKKLPAGHAFAKGITINNSSGIVMTTDNIGEPLRWFAYKDFSNHWRIYIYWATATYDKTIGNGFIITNEDDIQKLVPCDNNVLSNYTDKL